MLICRALFIPVPLCTLKNQWSSVALTHRQCLSFSCYFIPINSVVPSTVLVRVLHVLLCEGKVAVKCPDVGLLGAIAAALPYLLQHPLKWVGAHIPVKPQGIPAEELLQCPNPFVIGVLDGTKGGKRSLKASRPCPWSGCQETPPEDVAMLRVGYGAAGGHDDDAILQCGPEVQGANIVGNQSLAAQLDHAFAGTVNRSNGWSGSKVTTMGSLCGARGRSKRGAAACAHAYALGLTSNELAAVKRVQAVLSSYVTSLMGDAQTSWKSYGEMNEATGGKGCGTFCIRCRRFVEEERETQKQDERSSPFVVGHNLCFVLHAFYVLSRSRIRVHSHAIFGASADGACIANGARSFTDVSHFYCLLQAQARRRNKEGRGQFLSYLDY